MNEQERKQEQRIRDLDTSLTEANNNPEADELHEALLDAIGDLSDRTLEEPDSIIRRLQLNNA